jgi:sulfate-transporting ATPase
LAEDKKRGASTEKQIERELAWMRSADGQKKQKSFRARNFERLVAEKREKLANKRLEGINMLIPEGPTLPEAEAISFHNISYSVEERKLIENLSFSVRRGDILGIVGANGTGKTSLLKLLVAEKPLGQGSMTIHPDVVFGYNSQQRKLNPSIPLWREITGELDYVKISPDYSMHARSYVAQFNFSGQDQSKLVGSLSGGERNRVSLAKSLAPGCNIILLDEPTNDLDVDTLRNLEEALTQFDGAAIVVSHDRWFLDRICTAILSFEGGGKVRYVPGNYSEFVRVKTEENGGVELNKKQKFKRLI